MKRKTILALVAVAGSGASVALFVTQCQITEDVVAVVPLDEVVPDAERIDLADLTCENLCRGARDRDYDSINFCKLTALDVHPYVVCEIDDPGGFDRIEQALPYPSRLAPGTTGKIDASWCPVNDCLSPLRARLAVAGLDLPNAKVVGCRVQPRPAGFKPDERFVLCSYHLEHGWFPVTR